MTRQHRAHLYAASSALLGAGLVWLAWWLGQEAPDE